MEKQLNNRSRAYLLSQFYRPKLHWNWFGFFVFFISAALLQVSLSATIIYKQKDFSLEQEEYLQVHETKDLPGVAVEEKISELFNLLPMYTNIIASVRVPPEILDKMFADLVYTVEKGRRYSKTKYIVEKMSDRWFNVSEPPTMEGSLYIIHSDPAEHRYVFFVEGTYKTFTLLTGKMIVDVSFREIEKTQYLNVKTYIVLTNKFLWRMARFFSVFPSFRRKIERVVEQNIAYAIKVGKHTALSINKYEYSRR